MKHYFVDTNVIIDMLADREGFADAASEVFDAAGRGEIRISVCALSYSTIYYILRRHSCREVALEALRELAGIVSVLPVDMTVIESAQKSDFSDYEDAIQYYSAMQDSSIDAIITRNPKDFKLSDLPVILPASIWQ